MAQYAHETLQNPVKYAETVEKMRRLGIENPEGEVLRAIEASRVFKEQSGIKGIVRWIVTDYVSEGVIPEYHHLEDVPAGATIEYYDNREALSRRIVQLFGAGYTEHIDFDLTWKFRKKVGV